MMQAYFSVLVYQETYHREVYKTYHPKGRKSNFYHRLETPDRVGEAGMHKIGLGVFYSDSKTGERNLSSAHFISITFNENTGRQSFRFRFRGCDLQKESLTPM